MTDEPQGNTPATNVEILQPAELAPNLAALTEMETQLPAETAAPVVEAVPETTVLSHAPGGELVLQPSVVHELPPRAQESVAAARPMAEIRELVDAANERLALNALSDVGTYLNAIRAIVQRELGG